jgi:DNA-binding Lrp family transcriptional regulator
VHHFGFHAMAYVFLTVPPGELEATGHALSLHPETAFSAAITGAANLLAVVNCRDTDELYTYVTTKVGALPAVRQAEVVPVLRTVKQARSRLRGGRLELAVP